jgi:EAL domain-containing protein (putative c-di-GMP-specific phosphodiesterase class I)
VTEGRRERYFLETLLDDGKRIRRFVVHPMPFRVGRRAGLDLVLPSDSVSKQHAVIYKDGETLRVRDLGSTNGTWVNEERVDDTAVRVGDILHFAEFEFRIGTQPLEPAAPEPAGGPATASLRGLKLPQRFLRGTRELTDLIRTAAVVPVFQPILSLPEGALAGLEALGRGRYPGLPEAPAELFYIAASIGAEVQLSRLFRRTAAEAVRSRTDLPPLFLNTHPSELGQPGLIEDLLGLQEMAPRQKLYLEIHEGALADANQIAALRGELSRIGVGLAYDDFGAGQARLLELAEVPPHFLKFDRRFIHGIDRAPASRRRLLNSLVAAARDLLVQTIAEGIETEAEAEVCANVGFSHAQGFFFGAPIVAEGL